MTHARTMKDCQPQICGKAHSVAIPQKSLLSGRKYTPSWDTDIRKTFADARAAMKPCQP